MAEGKAEGVTCPDCGKEYVVNGAAEALARIFGFTIDCPYCNDEVKE